MEIEELYCTLRPEGYKAFTISLWYRVSVDILCLFGTSIIKVVLASCTLVNKLEPKIIGLLRIPHWKKTTATLNTDFSWNIEVNSFVLVFFLLLNKTGKCPNIRIGRPVYVSVWLCHIEAKSICFRLGNTVLKCLLHVRGVTGSSPNKV